MQTEYQPTIVPAAPRNRSTLRTVLIVLGAVVVALVIAGLIAGIASRGRTMSVLGDRLAASQAVTADLRDKLAESDSKVALADDEAVKLNGTIDAQSARLRACGLAISLGVKMDGALNDLVDNVLYNRSLAEYFNLQDRYSSLGGDWEDAASACAPGGGYTFS